MSSKHTNVSVPRPTRRRRFLIACTSTSAGSNSVLSPPTHAEGAQRAPVVRILSPVLSALFPLRIPCLHRVLTPFSTDAGLSAHIAHLPNLHPERRLSSIRRTIMNTEKRIDDLPETRRSLRLVVTQLRHTHPISRRRVAGPRTISARNQDKHALGPPC